MLEDALNQYFGFKTFRQGQKEVIESVLAQQDTLAILPTGNGKSLCYQLPGYLVDGIVIIISPLVSLMEDQVYGLQKQGEKHAIAFNSQLDLADRQYVMQHLQKYKFLFLSPTIAIVGFDIFYPPFKKAVLVRCFLYSILLSLPKAMESCKLSWQTKNQLITNSNIESL